MATSRKKRKVKVVNLARGTQGKRVMIYLERTKALSPSQALRGITDKGTACRYRKGQRNMGLDKFCAIVKEHQLSPSEVWYLITGSKKLLRDEKKNKKG